MTRARIFAALLVLIVSTAFGQVDTLRYDDITDIEFAPLLAGTMFPGELDAFWTARFTPVEKCTLRAVQFGLGFVRFQTDIGVDSIELNVFEADTVPPALTNIVATYRIAIGDQGFPAPNINPDNPLQQGLRALLEIPIDPPVVIAPKRDFIVGAKAVTRQSRMLDTVSRWNGLAMAAKTSVPEYRRYGRYRIVQDPSLTRMQLVTDNGYASILLRAVVEYDAGLPDTVVVADAPAVPAAAALALEQNHPNPFTGATTLRYFVPAEQSVVLAVYDSFGRRVALLHEGMQLPGMHTAVFRAGTSGNGLPAGVYLARLIAGGRSVTRAMVLARQ